MCNIVCVLLLKILEVVQLRCLHLETLNVAVIRVKIKRLFTELFNELQ